MLEAVLHAALVPNGPPSLIACNKLTVEGKCVFESGVVLKGDVKIIGGAEEAKTLVAGEYADITVTL